MFSGGIERDQLHKMGLGHLILSFVRYCVNDDGHYLFKVNNGNTNRTICKTHSKLTIKTPERGHWRLNIEQISHIVLVSPLSLNKWQVNASRDLFSFSFDKYCCIIFFNCTMCNIFTYTRWCGIYSLKGRHDFVTIFV